MAQITGVRVRETVPDSILDRADAIELVDITPDDLIQRLKEGKVYVPKQAERALEHFFSPANLTALRELALRRTAERVDEQLLERDAGARDLGSVGGRRAAPRLRQRRPARGGARALHQAPRRSPARALDGALRRNQAQPAIERGRAGPDRRYASARPGPWRRAGYHSRRRSPHRRRRGRLCASQQHHASRSSASPRGRAGSSCCTARSCAISCGSCGNISVHVIAGEELDKEPIPKKTVRTAEMAEPFDPRPYLFALLAVGLATGISELLWPWIGLENTDLVFLTAIVGIAVRFGLWPSLFASVASALCYNFFFTEPYYTFSVSDPTQRHGHPIFHDRRHHRLQRRGAGAQPRCGSHEPGAHHRVALCLQPQAVRCRHARRRAVGHGLPDRARC